MKKRLLLSLSALVLAMLSCTISLSETPDIQPDPSPVVIKPIPTATPVVFTVTGNVNVRSCPSASCATLGNLYTGDPIQAECTGGKWCRIRYEDKNAWVFAPCLGQEGICR